VLAIDEGVVVFIDDDGEIGGRAVRTPGLSGAKGFLKSSQAARSKSGRRRVIRRNMANPP
jgi:hypothetical protein